MKSSNLCSYRELLHTHITDFAILDVHFSPHDPEIFCTANSTNSISFFSLGFQDAALSLRFQQLCTLNCFPEGSLVLAVQWHPILKTTLGVTLSTGEVILCQVDSDLSAISLKTQASQTEMFVHGDSAWTLAFTPSSAGLLSGADDMVLHFQGLETKSNVEDQLTSWSNAKIHGAGITAILPLSNSVCITGSYDDHIRILNTPQTGRKSVLAELNLGGGVWRLKAIEELDPSWNGESGLDFHVLASCMHAGARILRISRSKGMGGQWRIEVRARFDQHQSMNYGSDFQPAHTNNELVVVSTSFYDKLVCLWKFKLW